MVKMAYNSVKCQKCDRPLSLSGNEIGIVMPFRDEQGTSKYGIFCASYRCCKMADRKIEDLQNNNYKYRVLYRNKKRDRTAKPSSHE